MPKKVKKEIKVKPIENHDKIQIDIKKDIEKEKKIKPKDIFQNYNNK